MSPARRAVVTADIFVRLSDVKSTAEKITVMDRILQQICEEEFSAGMKAANYAHEATMTMLMGVRDE